MVYFDFYCLFGAAAFGSGGPGGEVFGEGCLGVDGFRKGSGSTGHCAGLGRGRCHSRQICRSTEDVCGLVAEIGAGVDSRRLHRAAARPTPWKLRDVEVFDEGGTHFRGRDVG